MSAPSDAGSGTRAAARRPAAPGLAPDAPPYALDHLDTILNAPPVFLLDFDGVLSPIAPRPDEARLPAASRDALQRLARVAPMAIITGRDRDQVRTLVGLDAVLYAGNHGLELDDSGPAPELRGALDQAERELTTRLDGIRGVVVERKRFSVAVHDRLVAPTDGPRVRRTVEHIIQLSPLLRMTRGKHVAELRPSTPHDKGTAVRHLMSHPDHHGRRPIYLGDDTTDEDAFRVVSQGGVGILVASQPRPTNARYLLSDTDEVCRFLVAATTRLTGR